MEGVIILNTIAEEVHEGSIFGFSTVFGILCVFFGIIIAALSIIYNSDFNILFLMGVLLVAAGIITTYYEYPNNGEVVGYNYSYEVLIEDDVNFNEFTSKYEIIDQRGDIYTVVEKERG